MRPRPEPLPPLPNAGRCYRQTRRVELSDVGRRDRMRFDAVARFLQDIAMADVCDAGLDEPAWIVRRTRVQVAHAPRYLESVQVETYCWSLGKFAAERRTAITGERGGSIDTLTLWVRLDPVSGRPAPLTEAFRAAYAAAVAGRVTHHELAHAPPPAAVVARAWPLRACDFDLRGHVNNAACWAAVEEIVDSTPGPAPDLVEMEFRAAIPPLSRVEIVQSAAGDSALWLVAGGRTCASAVWWGTGDA